MATINSSAGELQQELRPFYCHHCTHQWMKSNNSQFECPACGQGFIEEVTEDFQPNAPELLPIDVDRPHARTPLLNFFFYQNDEDMDQDPETNARQTRRLPRQTSNTATRTRRNASQTQRQASRSRSPHVSVLVEANTGNAVRIGINTLHSRSAGRFLSVAIDDIMDTIFPPGLHSRPPAMTDEQMQEIPKVNITQEQVTNELMCSVCFEDFQINENEARKLQCDHIFHEKCIFPWLKTNASCPVCRTKLSNANPQAENNEDEEFASLIRIISEYQRRPPVNLASNSGASTSSSRIRNREQANGTSSSHFRVRAPRQSRQIESSSDEDTNQNNIDVPQVVRVNRTVRTRTGNSRMHFNLLSDAPQAASSSSRGSRNARNNVQSSISPNTLSSTAGQSNYSPPISTFVPFLPAELSTPNFASETYRTARVARIAARARIAEQAGQHSSRTATTANAAAGSYHQPAQLRRRRNAIDSLPSPTRPQVSQIPRAVRAVRMNPTVITIEDSGSESFESRSNSPFVAPMPHRNNSRDDLDNVDHMFRSTRHTRRPHQNSDLNED